MGCNGKKKYYIILKQFLSVEQNYGEIFLQDLFRKQGLLRSRWWRFEFSFAENKKEKTNILNVGSIHDNLLQSWIWCHKIKLLLVSFPNLNNHL